ncbi:MAG: 30S ribosomal protein S6 [Dichotomicrobium sp.]
MPQYEHVFLARQDVSAQQAESLRDEFSKVISEHGGQVGKSEYWGLKPLAYKIKKNRKAHYTLMNIDAPPDAVAEMERQMRLSGDVIRFLTLRVDELDDKPSPMMKRSEERRSSRRGGERGERGDRGDRSDRGDRGPRGGQE